MTTMKLTARDRWAGAGPEFNRAAAEVVYKAMSDMDEDTALVYGRLLVAGGVHYDLIAHRGELAKAAGELAQGRARTLHQHFTRTAVAKARAGQDATPEINALVQISKAGFDFTTQERQRFAAGRTRGEGGRFVQEHAKIETNDGKTPLDQNHARKVGIPVAGHLDGNDLAHYQQAYGQIQDMLAPFHGEDLNALLHLNIAGRDGQSKNATVAVEPGRGSATKIAHKLEAGDRIESAAVSVTPDATAQGAVFDALSAASSVPNPRVGGAGADAFNGVLGVDRMKQFNRDSRVVGENEPYSGASRAFGRLERGSGILQDSLGDAAPQKLKYALAVANHVGQYGPEAQKVFGPTADRAAYRYRGTERAPDPALRGAFQALANEGYRGSELIAAATEGKEGGPREGWSPGPVLRYFQRNLPDPDLNELQRKSGVVPPSEGVVIDRDGRLAAQSVGFADDWYLPFNLKHLASLKGGEYIRTRTFGGPTTEDIYTGLVSGAKSLTVVSHNGVYTMQFDKNLRGGRRFNDKATRMVGRYGQLLDALRSQQVNRGGISSSRMEELRGEARETEPDESSTQFDDKVQALVRREKRTPTLSQRERDEAAVDWLGETAAGLSTADVRTMAPDELVDQILTTRAGAALRADQDRAKSSGVKSPFTLQDFKTQETRRLEGAGSSPEARVRAVAEMMGQTRQLDQAMERATAANKQRVTPLQLDGKGYVDALTALHEQFPYYLGKPVYHPWKDAVGIAGLTNRTHEGARDTGYVMPRYNRPAEAQAGYFDTEVTGRGKVRADSTRYQNYRVSGGTIRDAGDRRPADDKARATAAAGGSASAPVDDKELQRAADLDLMNHLAAKTDYEPGAQVGGKESGGVNIGSDVQSPNYPIPAVKEFYSKTPAELSSMPPDDLNGLLKRVVTAVRANKLFKPDETKVSTFLAGGKVQPPEVLPSSLGEMLAQVGVDHKFPGMGSAYDPARLTSPETIERTYGADLKSFIDRGVVPSAVNIPKAEFDGKIAALRSELDAAQARSLRVRSRGGPRNVNEERRATLDAEGLLRATQLRRRWVDADDNRPPPPPAAADDDGYTSTSTEYRVEVPAASIAALSDEEYDKFAARTGAPPRPGRPQIIDGR